MSTPTSSFKKALKLGEAHREFFDWPNVRSVLDKLLEEVHELEEVALDPTQKARTFEEFSDVLFTLFQVARHLKIDPEKSLDFANQKYLLRFNCMSTILKQKGEKIELLDEATLLTRWNQAKQETASDLDLLLQNLFRTQHGQKVPSTQ